MTAVIDRRATRNMCTPLVKRIICRRRGHLARGALRTSPGHIRQRYSFRTDKFGFIAKPSQTICVCIFLSFSLYLRLKKCVYIYISFLMRILQSWILSSHENLRHDRNIFFRFLKKRFLSSKRRSYARDRRFKSGRKKKCKPIR